MRGRISPKVMATMIRNAVAPFTLAMFVSRAAGALGPIETNSDEAVAALNRKKPGCEMGLRHATGRPYESFIFLLEELKGRPEAG